MRQGKPDAGKFQTTCLTRWEFPARRVFRERRTVSLILHPPKSLAQHAQIPQSSFKGFLRGSK